jgi:hypothetical protein
VEVLRLRDVPNLFYTLTDEIDPLTIPAKYWRCMSEDIPGECFLAEGHLPPPGTPSKVGVSPTHTHAHTHTHMHMHTHRRTQALARTQTRQTDNRQTGRQKDRQASQPGRPQQRNGGSSSISTSASIGGSTRSTSSTSSSNIAAWRGI